jgi:hypothetical protein
MKIEEGLPDSEVELFCAFIIALMILFIGVVISTGFNIN